MQQALQYQWLRDLAEETQQQTVVSSSSSSSTDPAQHEAVPADLPDLSRTCQDLPLDHPAQTNGIHVLSRPHSPLSPRLVSTSSALNETSSS